MANSGPHSNGSEFFILYKSATHLNYKHTVFGNVVGGLTTLGAMEKVLVDDDDGPLGEIKIINVTVFVNPYTEPDEEEEKEKIRLGPGIVIHVQEQPELDELAVVLGNI